VNGDGPRPAEPLKPYRLGFAVKILANGGLKTNDARRHQNNPHLRHSIELLDQAFDHLDKRDLRVFRMSSSTVPYGTHPDLPQFDYRRQIADCAEELANLGAKARAYGIRLSTHPGQYTVLNAPDDDLAHKSALDLEQDAALLDALGAGPEACVVVHVGGTYGDKASARDRFAKRHARLSERAQARVAVEHDERQFDLADVLWLHERTGARVIYDFHHHRCNPATGYEEHAHAVAAATATWPEQTRPKVHLSSPRTELRLLRGKPAAPLLDQHADFATPWDLAELLSAANGPVDVMVEAKAKDLAVEWLRTQMERLFPALAAAEERTTSSPASPAKPPPARSPTRR
jgi:UV DNA damage endonuclease